MEQEREYIFVICANDGEEVLLRRQAVPDFIKQMNVHSESVRRLEFGDDNFLNLTDGSCNGRLLIRGTVVRPVPVEVKTKWGLE